MPLPKDLDELLQQSHPEFIILDDERLRQIKAYLVAPDRPTVSFERWQRETRQGIGDYNREIEWREELDRYLKRLVHYNRTTPTNPPSGISPADQSGRTLPSNKAESECPIPIPWQLYELLRESYPTCIGLDANQISQLKAYLVAPHRLGISGSRLLGERHQGQDDYSRKVKWHRELHCYMERLVHYNGEASADSTLTKSDTEQSRSNDVESDPPALTWPNPEDHTIAKVWTVKEGAIRMSTKTKDGRDGLVEFAPTEFGEPTYQMRLMQLLCLKFPKPVSLADVLEQVYEDEIATVSSDPVKLRNMLRRVRTLVSDIRTKKLAKAQLNPDILPALSIDATQNTGIALRLAHLHRMDDKKLDEADEPAL